MKSSTTRLALVLLLTMLLAGCHASNIGTQPAALGSPATMATMQVLIDEPGPIVFEKHLAANWAISLSGLLNLDHPKAVAAGLEDREEPIQIYVYSLHHPQFGTFLVDSGMSVKFVDAANNDDISMVVSMAMNIPALDVKLTTADLIAQLNGVDGVFLTHIHLDHIMGLTDLPSNVAVYSGPGEATASSMLNIASQGTTDRLLANVSTLQEWQFDDEGVIDVFGDGSVWAIHTPGHTPGATAYLVRSTTGPQLLIGDATHTKWGWDNGVEPGPFSLDIPLSAASLSMLKQLAKDHPEIIAHPGHQSL
tara:strand:- start:61641 stop:62561 length:921 start_codon:yes stop_codon:yes gene_type:complete